MNWYLHLGEHLIYLSGGKALGKGKIQGGKKEKKDPSDRKEKNN